MGSSRLMRKPLAWAAAALIAAGAFGGAQLSNNDPRPSAPTYSKDAVYIYATAIDLEIVTLTAHLAEAALDGSDADDAESLTELERAISLVISGLLEKRVDPGDPNEIATKIDTYLVIRGLPRPDYSKAREDLQKIYVAMKTGSSTAELSQKVAKEVLCQSDAA